MGKKALQRIEPGESLSVGLVREAKEECGLDIEIGEPLYVGEWSPVVKGNQLQIFGIFFKCFPKNINVKLGPDHDEYQWISLHDRENYDLIPPNKEVLQILIEKINGGK